MAQQYLENNMLMLLDNIVRDERFEKGKKLNEEDLEKIKGLVTEWRDVLCPTMGFYHDSMSSIVDMFFGDFKAAHERLTDEGAEIMSRFGESLKKIEEKF